MSQVRIVSTALLFLSSLTLSASAQQTIPQTNQQPDRTIRAQGSIQLDQAETQFFASKLALCNNAEIQMANIAASKASNDEVKQLAQMLAQDHAKSNDRLQSFVANYAERPRTSAHQQSGIQHPDHDSDRLAQDRPQNPTEDREQGLTGDRRQNLPGDRRQDLAGNPQQTDRAIAETSYRMEASAATLQRLYEVCRQVHHKQLEACKEKLAEKSGSDFDKAFMLGQMASHGAMIAELAVLETQTSGEFQNLVREAKTSAEKHIDKMEQLCKQLDDDKDDRDRDR